MKSCKSAFYFRVFVNEKRKRTSNIIAKPKDLEYKFWNWKEIWNMNLLRNNRIHKANFIFFTKQKT